MCELSERGSRCQRERTSDTRTTRGMCWRGKKGAEATKRKNEVRRNVKKRGRSTWLAKAKVRRVSLGEGAQARCGRKQQGRKTRSSHPQATLNSGEEEDEEKREGKEAQRRVQKEEHEKLADEWNGCFKSSQPEHETTETRDELEAETAKRSSTVERHRRTAQRSSTKEHYREAALKSSTEEQNRGPVQERIEATQRSGAEKNTENVQKIVNQLQKWDSMKQLLPHAENKNQENETRNATRNTGRGRMNPKKHKKSP